MANPQRKTNVSMEMVGDGLALYDRQQQRSHVLNATSALVYQHCDGRTTPQQLTDLLRIKFNLARSQAEQLLWLALDELEKAGLLQAKITTTQAPQGMLSRRQALKGFAAAGLSLALLPIVSPAMVARAENPTTTTTTTAAPPNQPPVLTSDQDPWIVTSVPGFWTATGTFSDPDGGAVEIIEASSSGSVEIDNWEQSCHGCSSGTWTAYGAIFDSSGGSITLTAIDNPGFDVGSVTFSVAYQLPPTTTTTTVPPTTTTPAPPTFPFDGFFPPVDNPPVFNVAKAGRAIPVKFSLGGYQGMDIFATGYPSSRAVACDSGAPLNDIEEETSGTSGLHYDAGSDQYIYVWKTARSWGGTCRKLTLRLTDGTDHEALFKFR